MFLANQCPHCGGQYFVQNTHCAVCGGLLPAPVGTLTLYGIDQKFLIGGKVKVLLDGQVVCDLPKRDSVTLAITRPCEVSVKLGLNVFSEKMRVFPGTASRLQVKYNRWLGYFQLEIVK